MEDFRESSPLGANELSEFINVTAVDTHDLWAIAYALLSKEFEGMSTRAQRDNIETLCVLVDNLQGLGADGSR